MEENKNGVKPWIIKIIQCYVHKNVSLAGTIDIHQCAGKQRFISWLEALELRGTVSNSSNTDNCNGKCEYVFTIQWEEQSQKYSLHTTASISMLPRSGSWRS